MWRPWKLLNNIAMTATATILRKANTKRVAERLFKEYVWSATGALGAADLPYYDEPVVVSASTIQDLFLLSQSDYFQSLTNYVEYEYKDLPWDKEDAVIVVAKDENGNELGTLKFVSA